MVWINQCYHCKEAAESFACQYHSWGRNIWNQHEIVAVTWIMSGILEQELNVTPEKLENFAEAIGTSGVCTPSAKVNAINEHLTGKNQIGTLNFWHKENTFQTVGDAILYSVQILILHVFSVPSNCVAPSQFLLIEGKAFKKLLIAKLLRSSQIQK